MRFRAVAVVAMLIRPPVAGVVLLFAALGVAAAGAAETAHPLFTTVLVILAGWFVNAAALNDLADEQIDRVNLPSARGRPLVSGHATRRELGVVAAVAAVVALGVAAAVGWPVVLVVAAGLAINAAYSLRPFRVSRRGVLAPLTVAAGFVVVPYLIGVLSVTRSPEPAELALLPGLYVAFVGRILLKDFRDAAGDAMFGKWTFLLQARPGHHLRGERRLLDRRGCGRRGRPTRTGRGRRAGARLRAVRSTACAHLPPTVPTRSPNRSSSAPSPRPGGVCASSCWPI